MGKGRNLVRLGKQPANGERLTNNLDGPFVVAFKYRLETGFRFTDMKESDLRPFQSFLDKVSNMTWTQVDRSYRRPPDKHDEFRDMQVEHYEVTGKFRIHGVVENARFKVIRIDPNHEKHK
jgi:hypothetical protein